MKILVVVWFLVDTKHDPFNVFFGYGLVVEIILKSFLIPFVGLVTDVVFGSVELGSAHPVWFEDSTTVFS